MDRRADCVAIGFGSDQVETDAAISGYLVVAIKVCGAVVGRDQQIEIAVAIEVAVRQAASDFWLIETAAGFGATSRKLPLPLFRKSCGGCA